MREKVKGIQGDAYNQLPKVVAVYFQGEASPFISTVSLFCFDDHLERWSCNSAPRQQDKKVGLLGNRYLKPRGQRDDRRINLVSMPAYECDQYGVSTNPVNASKVGELL